MENGKSYGDIPSFRLWSGQGSVLIVAVFLRGVLLAMDVRLLRINHPASA